MPTIAWNLRGFYSINVLEKTANSTSPIIQPGYYCCYLNGSQLERVGTSANCLSEVVAEVVLWSALSKKGAKALDIVSESKRWAARSKRQEWRKSSAICDIGCPETIYPNCDAIASPNRIAMMILGFRHSLHLCASFTVISRSSAHKLVTLFPPWADEVISQLSLGALPFLPLTLFFRSLNRKRSHGLICGL
jgi:hypothetical protein